MNPAPNCWCCRPERAWNRVPRVPTHESTPPTVDDDAFQFALEVAALALQWQAAAEVRREAA